MGCLAGLPVPFHDGVMTHLQLSAVSPLYSAAPQPPRLEAVPTDQDFIAALQSLGFRSQTAATADDSKQQHSLSEGHEQQPARGTLYHLQLVLRTWAAVCRYKSKVPGLETSQPFVTYVEFDSS